MKDVKVRPSSFQLDLRLKYAGGLIERASPLLSGGRYYVVHRSMCSSAVSGLGKVVVLKSPSKLKTGFYQVRQDEP